MPFSARPIASAEVRGRAPSDHALHSAQIIVVPPPLVFLVALTQLSPAIFVGNVALAGHVLNIAALSRRLVTTFVEIKPWQNLQVVAANARVGDKLVLD